MWTRRHFLTALSSGVPSQLADGPFRLTLPLRLRVFHDGAWVVAAGDAAGDDASTLLGRRVDAIGRLAVPELIRAFTVEWPGNAAWAHRWSAGALASPAFLQALERRPTPQEDWAKAAGGGNYVRALDDWTCFLSLDDMDDVEGKTFEMLTREVFALFERADTRRLIVDLRRNGGGNNYLGEALRKGIGRAHVNRPGGLYVLIGSRTFSAAQNLASRLERETFATFVGEPTGGAPNHHGDAKVATGAATGLTAMVSTLPWFDSYPQDQRPWIFPDLLVPETFADWQAGRDQVLAAAVEHRTGIAADELARDRIFYFRRASQQQAWGPFRET